MFNLDTYLNNRKKIWLKIVKKPIDFNYNILKIIVLFCH